VLTDNKIMHLIKILKPIALGVDVIDRVVTKVIKQPLCKSQLGYCGHMVSIRNPRRLSSLSRIFMYDNTNLMDGFTFMSHTGRLIMKKNSGASTGLTVITGNHGRSVGKPFKINNVVVSDNDIEQDVVLEEDVWIGADVIICSGVTIGRAANIGAGSVIRNNIPPYSVVMGNPAKVVGFCFTPEEIIEHEKALYPEDERLPLDLLEKNYNKYFISRIKEIKEFTRLSL